MKKGGEGAKTATGKKKKLLPDNNDDASSKSIVPYQYSAPAKDIDEADKDDPQFCTTYVEDIQSYLRSKESSVPPDYMGSAVEINEHMRMILVNWYVYCTYTLLRLSCLICQSSCSFLPTLFPKAR